MRALCKQQHAETALQRVLATKLSIQMMHAHLLSVLLPLLTGLLDCDILDVKYCMMTKVVALALIESLEQGALAQQAVTLSFHCLQLLHQLLVLNLVLQAWKLS